MPADLLPEFGPGKCSKYVARLRKELYGRHNAARAFSRVILIYLELPMDDPDIEIRIFTSDRCVFSVKWNGEFLIMLPHVDDGLQWYTDVSIRDEFNRRISLKYIIEVTDDVDVYCGIEFRVDPTCQRLELSQHRHLDMVLDLWGARDLRPAQMPQPGGQAAAAAATPWTGVTDPVACLDYATFVGDTVWLTRTRPDIALAVSDLARHIRAPGPAQVHAARHLPRFLKDTRDYRLTFDASDSNLTQGWDRRNKPIVEFDAGLPEPGSHGITGVVAYLNGGPIPWLSRRQRSISRSSCEAETNAGALATELSYGLQDLQSEVLECWGGPAMLRGDCRGSQKQIAKGTDKLSRSSYRSSFAYMEHGVTSGRTFLDQVPREHNSSDNMTQQGHPHGLWRTRPSRIVGTSPEVYVTGYIRDTLKEAAKISARVAAATSHDPPPSSQSTTD